MLSMRIAACDQGPTVSEMPGRGTAAKAVGTLVPLSVERKLKSPSGHALKRATEASGESGALFSSVGNGVSGVPEPALHKPDKARKKWRQRPHYPHPCAPILKLCTSKPPMQRRKTATTLGCGQRLIELELSSPTQGTCVSSRALNTLHHFHIQFDLHCEPRRCAAARSAHRQPNVQAVTRINSVDTLSHA